MFDSQTSNLQMKFQMIKNDNSNEQDKENRKRGEHNILVKGEASIFPHSPKTYLKTIQIGESLIKTNVAFPRSTEYTNNKNLSHSHSKFFPSTNLKNNPFHNLNLDYYIKNFTSPRKIFNEETALMNKHNINFRTLISCSASKDKPKLTQSESRQISLEASKQKYLIHRLNMQISGDKLKNDNANSSNRIASNCPSNTKTDKLTINVCSETSSNLIHPQSFIQSDSSVISKSISNGGNSIFHLGRNNLNSKNINLIPEAENEADETIQSQILHQEAQSSKKYDNDIMIDRIEYEKNPLISKDKINDEVYKLLRVKKNLRKPEACVSSSTRKITDMKKFDEDCLIDDVFGYDVLSRKKKVHSVKKVFVSEIKLYNSKLNGFKTFKIFRDCEIGINPYWQSHLISADQDDDIESDDEQIEMAYIHTLKHLQSGILSLINKSEGCLRNEWFLSQNYQQNTIE